MEVHARPLLEVVLILCLTHIFIFHGGVKDAGRKFLEGQLHGGVECWRFLATLEKEKIVHPSS